MEASTVAAQVATNVAAVGVAYVVAKYVPRRHDLVANVVAALALVAAAYELWHGWGAAALAWGAVHGCMLGRDAARRPPAPNDAAVAVPPAARARRALDTASWCATASVHCLHAYRQPHALALMARAAGWHAVATTAASTTRRRRHAWRAVGVAAQWCAVVAWVWTYRGTWSIVGYAAAYLPMVSTAPSPRRRAHRP
jgi:hypothetical protein